MNKGDPRELMNQITIPNALPIRVKVIEYWMMKTGIANECLRFILMSKEPVAQYLADQLAKVFSPPADYRINLSSFLFFNGIYFNKIK